MRRPRRCRVQHRAMCSREMSAWTGTAVAKCFKLCFFSYQITSTWLVAAPLWQSPLANQRATPVRPLFSPVNEGGCQDGALRGARRANDGKAGMPPSLLRRCASSILAHGHPPLQQPPPAARCLLQRRRRPATGSAVQYRRQAGACRLHILGIVVEQGAAIAPAGVPADVLLPRLFAGHVHRNDPSWAKIP